VVVKEENVDQVEDMLRKWRADRAAHPHRESVSDRRRLEVKGQEVMVVRKKPKIRPEISSRVGSGPECVTLGGTHERVAAAGEASAADEVRTRG